MPLPLPATLNWYRLLKHSVPCYIRDVTVNHSRDTIKYIEMEIMEETKETTTDAASPPQSYLE
uniref:Uncharacterized protein n=1 Tax=Leersia perrieri TaxID=77586 RepID=A0A0D9WXI2_9ORYZ